MRAFPFVSHVVTKKQLRELKKLLKPEAYRWFQLGFQMRMNIDELRKIEKESGRQRPDVCFLGVIELFLQNEPSERKWEVS